MTCKFVFNVNPSSITLLELPRRISPFHVNINTSPKIPTHYHLIKKKKKHDLIATGQRGPFFLTSLWVTHPDPIPRADIGGRPEHELDHVGCDGVELGCLAAAAGWLGQFVKWIEAGDE